ncbi:MAG TPA: metallopeptidase TldD-related protein [Mycobacteriales bacterium]|nr:metallopeptidase TldD-related protein [Mycobacteriales bacterium]
MTPQELAERVLSLSQTDGCVVLIRVTAMANLRWAGSTLTTNGVTRTTAITVIAVDGVSAGSVTRTGVTADRLEDVVRAAELAARSGGPALDAQPLVAGGADPTWLDPPGETSIATHAGTVSGLRRAFDESRSGGYDLYGYAEHTVETTYLASSTGLRRRHQQPGGVLELTGRADGGARSAWAGLPLRTGDDVDVASLASDVRRRLEWARRRVDLPAGRYDTVLPPTAVGDLMTYLLWSSGGLDAHEGRTVFSAPGGATRVGEQVCPLPLTMSSDPAMAGWSSSPFVIAPASARTLSVFDNGLPLEPTDWIRDGRLQTLVTSRAEAAVTGLAVAPMIGNLILSAEGAVASAEDMVASMQRGLLLTCLWYIREVDPQTLLLTGLTRDGVFLVEGGEVVGAVSNYRFNESPVDLLSRCAEVGASVATLPREFGESQIATVMPPLRIPDFNMSSVSDAS